MAIFVWTNARLFVDEIDLSAQFNQLSLDYNVDTLDATAMQVAAMGTRIRKAGLWDVGIAHHGFLDFTDAAIEEQLNDSLRQAVIADFTTVDAAIHKDQTGGPSYVDETADANSAGGADVAPFPTLGDDTDDAFLIGKANKFDKAKIDTATAGAGDAVAGESVWEYSQGADNWAELTTVVDDTDEFTASAATDRVISFVPPSDWQKDTVNSQGPYYYIRLRLTADNVYNTTPPVLDQVWVQLIEAEFNHTIIPLPGGAAGVIADGDKAYFGKFTTGRLSWGGEVGSMGEFDWEAKSIDQLAIGRVSIDDVTAVSGAVDGTAYEFGNVATFPYIGGNFDAGDRVVAMVHVIADDFTDLDIVLETDDVANFGGTPETQASVVNISGVSSFWLESDGGAITDDFVRLRVSSFTGSSATVLGVVGVVRGR